MSWILRHDMRIVSSVQFLVTRSIVMQCEKCSAKTYCIFRCYLFLIFLSLHKQLFITAQSRVITAHFVYHCTVFYALIALAPRDTNWNQHAGICLSETSEDINELKQHLIETWSATTRALSMKQLISVKIVLMHVSKPKANGEHLL